MEFRRVLSWVSDEMPETTEAIVSVSSCGVVKVGSYKMWSKHNNSYSLRKSHIYTPSSNRGKQRNEADSWKSKYLHVHIRDKAFSVHRLVGLAWIPNPENKPQINHKNGVRSDNRASNLEWMTNLENRRHAIEFVPRDAPRGEQVPSSKLKEYEVVEIKEALKTPYRGILKDLGEKYGVGKSTIHWIKKGGSWAHV